MEKDQRIACTIGSCKYNDCDGKKCNLNKITVTPVEGNDAKTPAESMCSSYENE